MSERERAFVNGWMSGWAFVVVLLTALMVLECAR